MAELEQKLGQTPTEAQMAKALKMTPPEYSELLDRIRPAAFVCLDATCCSDGTESANLYEVVADPSENCPVEEVSRRELKQVILERLKQLPEIQRKVLALYYGEDLRLREIAEVFGLTESRICQIHSQAVLSIRSYLQRYEAGLAGRSACMKHS
jgi:RNA polymerase sigma factor for flagellar operon FliA